MFALSAAFKRSSRAEPGFVDFDGSGDRAMALVYRRRWKASRLGLRRCRIGSNHPSHRRCRSSGVEHSLGKGEVESSNLSGSTISLSWASMRATHAGLRWVSCGANVTCSGCINPSTIRETAYVSSNWVQTLDTRGREGLMARRFAGRRTAWHSGPVGNLRHLCGCCLCTRNAKNGPSWRLGSAPAWRQGVVLRKQASIAPLRQASCGGSADGAHWRVHTPLRRRHTTIMGLHAQKSTEIDARLNLLFNTAA